MLRLLAAARLLPRVPPAVACAAGYPLPSPLAPARASATGGVGARLMSMVCAGDTEFDIPRSKVTVAFSRSSGAGGQNVNKVNTKAELRFNIDAADWLDDHCKLRLKLANAAVINKEGELIVVSQRHRTQEANLEDAFIKLRQLVRDAAKIPKVRAMKTGLSDFTKSERREDKRHRSEVKAHRKAKPSWDE